MGREIQNDMLPISLETCNNVGIDGDLLVKQFARSLQGNAFDWQIDLAPECIDS